MNERDKILTALEEDKRREIYRAGPPPFGRRRTDDYWISFQGGGPFQEEVVRSMVRDGLLKRKYEGCDCYDLSES
jgi:hypothetical protein